MKRKLDLYIIAESLDNSDGAMTLSNDLVAAIGLNKKKIMSKTPNYKDGEFIFVFWNKDRKCFAFKKVENSFVLEAQCELIVYNQDTKNYGFTPIIPNMPSIFYRLNITANKVKFKVEKQKIDDMIIYNMTDYEPID